jgi:hypothetical protein
MLGRTFYHGALRKLVIAFGSVFNNLQIEREDGDGNVIKVLPIPLQYVSKEKFIRRINEYASIDEPNPRIQETLPRMGFEVEGITYASERKTNTIDKIFDKSDNSTYMFNRVPYDVDFSLYIATRKIDDAFRIVEQIIPYFTPELNIKIQDMMDFDLVTNVPLVLRATNFDLESDGGFDERRTVMWQLQFSAKAYMYGAVRDADLVKRAIVDLHNVPGDVAYFAEEYMASVDPDTQEIDEVISSTRYYDSINNSYAGESVTIDSLQ